MLSCSGYPCSARSLEAFLDIINVLYGTVRFVGLLVMIANERTVPYPEVGRHPEVDRVLAMAAPLLYVHCPGGSTFNPRNMTGPKISVLAE